MNGIAQSANARFAVADLRIHSDAGKPFSARHDMRKKYPPEPTCRVVFHYKFPDLPKWHPARVPSFCGCRWILNLWKSCQSADGPSVVRLEAWQGHAGCVCSLGNWIGRVPQIALHLLTGRINSQAMSIAELRQLPRREKLQIVESLWSDLAAEESLVQSPSWHGEELRKTEEDLKLGKVRPVNWEAAKRKLRKQFE